MANSRRISTRDDCPGVWWVKRYDHDVGHWVAENVFASLEAAEAWLAENPFGPSDQVPA
jgi:hypothetical protein